MVRRGAATPELLGRGTSLVLVGVKGAVVVLVEVVRKGVKRSIHKPIKSKRHKMGHLLLLASRHSFEQRWLRQSALL